MWSICTNPGSVLLGFLLLTRSQSTQNLEKETQSDLTSNWLQVFFLPFFHPPWKESFQLFLRIRQLTLRFSSPSPEHKAVQWQQRTHSSSELANILSKPSPKTEGEEIQLGLAEVWVSQPPVWIHTSACSGPEALHHKCLRAKPGSREFHTLAWKMIFGLEKQFSFLSKFSFTISSWRKALKKKSKTISPHTKRNIQQKYTSLSSSSIWVTTGLCKPNTTSGLCEVSPSDKAVWEWQRDHTLLWGVSQEACRRRRTSCFLHEKWDSGLRFLCRIEFLQGESCFVSFVSKT